MELIKYRKTLDVHKNGVQFMLQGFQTADNMSRVIEISLMASGDAIDFPLERIVAMMYVTTPGAEEPSINSCTIKDNKVIYDVLPIVEEGITKMQLKIIEASPDGAKRVLCAPEFAVEVTKSGADDESVEQTTTFTALEDAAAKAKTVYDERFLRMELTSDCIFKAYYADGTTYETDLLKKLFHEGNSVLAESFAKGGTGVRAGEDTDNSKYYSNVSKSEALNAKDIMENSEKILEEVRLHGVYTAFKVDFETGNVEYVSPSFKFKVNMETGELETEGQSYTFNDEIGRVVSDWLKANNIVLADLQKMATEHGKYIEELKKLTQSHEGKINSVRPIEKGGTGATTKEEARANLEITPENIGVPEYFAWNVDDNLTYISPEAVSFCFTGNIGNDSANLNGTYREEESEKIYMKNSGQIYLSYSLESQKESYFSLVSCQIRVNGTAVKTYDSSTFTNTSSTQTINENLLLTVNKGDIITVYIKSLIVRESADSDDGHHRFNLNGIIANAETPYIYRTLYDGAEEITVSDILNALTGGVE
ncbi:MAG: hypothetical protein E7391_06105 [Ruminococcaceae bacterium]|nr:hypothetical protein [Oscillospiraceae bacterium]